MAQLIVRNLEEDVKARLKRRASSHGSNLEEEVRNCMGLIGATSLDRLGVEYLTRVTPMGPWHEHSTFRPLGPESMR